MTSNELIKKIFELNISDVISKYLPLKKRGVNYLAICPFHQDSDPSLTINDQKNIFKCFACNESGNSVTFVQKYKNCSFIDAILEIAKLFNFDEELIKSYDGKVANEQVNNKIYLINELYLELCKNFLFNKKNGTVLNYLKQRGITKEIIDYFGIGYNPEGNTLYDLMTNNDSNYLISDNNCYTRQDLLDANLININKNGFVQDVFGNRIVFSIKNSDGQIAGFSGRVIGNNNSPKYLNTIENKIFHKSKLLYNWNNAKNYLSSNKIFLVEGFMDVIALYKAKINNVVGTMGVSLSEHHIEIFKKSKNIKHVILGFDNDEAGKTATISAGEHLFKKGLNVFVVDQTNNDCKDFDEYVNKYNEDALDLLLKKQIHFSIFYLNQIINKYNLETISDQELFLIKALEIIKKYGNILYKEQYIIFLTQQINYPTSVLSKKIHHALENQESYVSKEQSYQQHSNENFARSLKTFKNTTIKILQAFFKDRLSIQIFKDEYTLLGKVNNFDEFNEIYDLLYRSFYFLQDFYDQYQQFNSITNENSFSILIDYINTKIDKKYQSKFKKLFQEVYKSNESIYFTYEFTRKNFHRIIISCLESDLETRKIFLLNKIKDDYQKTGIWEENADFLKYNELLTKINKLHQQLKAK